MVLALLLTFAGLLHPAAGTGGRKGPGKVPGAGRCRGARGGGGEEGIGSHKMPLASAPQAGHRVLPRLIFPSWFWGERAGRAAAGIRECVQPV